MSAKINGGPAFPVDTRTSNSDFAGEFGHQTSPSTWQFPGMTLRDWFAGKELSKAEGTAVCDIPEAYDRLAKHCYRMADAMLKAREADDGKCDDKECCYNGQPRASTCECSGRRI